MLHHKCLTYHKTAEGKTFNSARWNVIPGNLNPNDNPESVVIIKIESRLGATPEIIMGPIEWYLYQEDPNVVFRDRTFLCYLPANAQLKLNNKHITETAWGDVRNSNLPEGSAPFLEHNLHM